MNKAKTQTIIRTGVALFSMAAIVMVLALPLTTLPSTTKADTITNSNVNINSNTSSSNSSSSSNSTSCNNTCTYPPTTGTCVANVSSANIGDTVAFTVHPAGGTTGYQYDWSGVVTGHTPTITQTFETAGVKTATVTIYSAGTPAVANCSVTINGPTTTPTPPTGGCNNTCTYPPTTGYCVSNVSTANIGDTVSFTVHPSGGTTGYQYDWSGVVTGHTPTITQTFETAGVKTATVTIYSYGTPAVANCSVTINPPVVTPISVICNASATVIDSGSSVTFTATASGGSSYNYSWNGDDGVSGSNRTMTKSYTTSGVKNVTVTATASNGQTASANCSVTVNIVIVQQPVAVICNASATVVNTGSTVTFTASATGGSGTYGYNWSGDGVTGSNQSATASYTTSGTKSITVTAYSNGKSATAQCSVTVNIIVVNQPISIVCYPSNTSVNIGNGVTYTATATGGDGNYTYSWTGSNGMTGNSSTAYMSYPYSGSQSATVTVYSNGQTASATCNTNVIQTYVPQNNLSVYCVANPSTINVGQNMTWTAYATGGNGGNYTYSWNGSNGFSNNNNNGYNNYNNNTVSYTYQNPGQVNMTVTVNSNGQTASANCTGYVNQNQQYIQPVQPIVTVTPQPPVNPTGGVYLSAIPATGISSSAKTDLFIAGMFIWSAFAAYLFLARRNNKLALAALGASDVAAPAMTESEVIAPATVSLSETIGTMAREHNILFSHDALSAIAAQANGDEATAGSLVNSIAAKIGASENFTTVNMQKLNELTA